MSYSILIVDDNQRFREELCEALDEFKFIEAKNGAEALEILRAPNVIDAVLLDVMMPGMSGTDVLREIKKISPEISVVISTGHGSKDVVLESLKGRADDFIEKPINIEKLKNLLTCLLSSKEPELCSLDIKGKVERVKQFAERNFDKKVTLKDAADLVALSSKYLSRIFSQETGVGFAEYRTEIKMNKAKEMLESTGYNVDQISAKLAYENTESFIRAFKKSLGCTPTEYRKQVQNNKKVAGEK